VPLSQFGKFDPSIRSAVGQHWVRGYVRADGTRVNGHFRTNPDGYRLRIMLVDRFVLRLWAGCTCRRTEQVHFNQALEIAQVDR